MVGWERPGTDIARTVPLRAIYEVIVRTERYYTRLERPDALSRALIRRLEHVYYKATMLNDKTERDLAAKLGIATEEVRVWAVGRRGRGVEAARLV
jgi:hypothetical protein